MTNTSNDPSSPRADGTELPGPLAARILERASELDAVQGPAARVAELRAAALEAGISERAFDAALEEMQRAQHAAAANALPSAQLVVSRKRRLVGVVAGVFAALIGAFAVLRMVMPPSTAATVEEAFLLRCLAPGDAAALVRPIVSDANSRVTINPTQSPNVLTVRTTPDRMARVKAMIAAQDGNGASCTPPTPPPR